MPAPDSLLAAMRYLTTSQAARLTGKGRDIPATVDFPTPPFAEDTAMTLRTSRRRRLSGRPRCMRGRRGAFERGRPWWFMSRWAKQWCGVFLPEGFHAGGCGVWRRIVGSCLGGGIVLEMIHGWAVVQLRVFTCPQGVYS